MTESANFSLESLKGKINPLFFKNEIFSKISELLKDFKVENIQVRVSKNGNHVEIEYPITTLDKTTHSSNTNIATLDINENNEVSISTISQSYCYRDEVRYHFMQRVGYEVFTQSNSLILDSNGLKLYSSWFSDEAKIEDPEGTRYSSTQELLMDTRPTIENGVLKDLPNTTYAPFSNYWQRYKNSNIYRDWGRSPINGEYSNIGITFNEKMKDIHVIKTSYGRTYYQNRRICANEEDIIRELQSLFNESYDKNNNIFDDHNFYYGLQQYQDEVNAEYEI